MTVQLELFREHACILIDGQCVAYISGWPFNSFDDPGAIVELCCEYDGKMHVAGNESRILTLLTLP